MQFLYTEPTLDNIIVRFGVFFSFIHLVVVFSCFTFFISTSLSLGCLLLCKELFSRVKIVFQTQLICAAGDQLEKEVKNKGALSGGLCHNQSPIHITVSNKFKLLSAAANLELIKTEMESQEAVCNYEALLILLLVPKHLSDPLQPRVGSSSLRSNDYL